jgi:plastocyanin
MACGGDDDDSGGTATQPAGATTRGSTDGASATPTQDNGGGGATFVEIDAADFSFSPSEVSAAAGIDLDIVISNTGQATHTFNLYRDAGYTQPVEDAETGNIFSETVDEFHVTLDAGEYFFRCEIHPQQMQGTLTAS